MHAIDQRGGGIPGGEDVGRALDLKKAVDRDAAEPVVRAGERRRERMRAHTGTPDNGLGRDLLARRQAHAMRIDRGDRHPGPRLDTERGQRLIDHRAGGVSHGGADPRRAVDEDHPRRRRAGDVAQPCRQFRRHLDPGQSAADHQRGEPTR